VSGREAWDEALTGGAAGPGIEPREATGPGRRRRRRRFAVKHPRWEQYGGNPPVRFCAGGASWDASLPRSISVTVLTWDCRVAALLAMTSRHPFQSAWTCS